MAGSEEAALGDPRRQGAWPINCLAHLETRISAGDVTLGDNVSAHKTGRLQRFSTGAEIGSELGESRAG
jgi:hypothetical protein